MQQPYLVGLCLGTGDGTIGGISGVHAPLSPITKFKTFLLDVFPESSICSLGRCTLQNIEPSP